MPKKILALSNSGSDNRTPFEIACDTILVLSRKLNACEKRLNEFERNITAWQGPRGDKGEFGPKGETGLPGIKGETGDIGPQGKDGLIGSTGKQGPIGEKGDKGEIGLKGEDGVKGETGEPGKDGIKGEKGERGDIGEIGPQGNQGENGKSGEKGKDGINGKDGRGIKLIKIEDNMLVIVYDDETETRLGPIVSEVKNQKMKKTAEHIRDPITHMIIKTIIREEGEI